MKFSLVLSLAMVIAALAAACQNRPVADPNANANTNAANTGGPAHDMSNMNSYQMAGHDMSNMNAMASAPGAAEQPYDLQFIDSMVHHHEGAIQMANMVIGKTERPELKAFAQKIIDDQSKEIARMKEWRERWYAGESSALNMELHGMVGGTKMMNSEHMKEMDQMEPSHFDGHFLKMMIAHHEGAVEMSKEALKRAEHPEIRQLAQEIIKAQEAEIKQMKTWQEAWEK